MNGTGVTSKAPTKTFPHLAASAPRLDNLVNQVILLHAVGDRELDLCFVSVASACRVATMPWSRRKYIQELDTLGEIQIDSFTSFMNLGSAQGCISST